MTWRVQVTQQAWLDVEDILGWTAQRFGARQSRAYERLIGATIERLREGPDVIGSRPRSEVRPGLRSLHVARRGKRGRHFLFYRVVSQEHRVLAVTRVLHDSMDFAQHFEDED